jgi:hypothetical protein
MAITPVEIITRIMLASATVNALAVGFCIPLTILAAVQRVVTDRAHSPLDHSMP